MAKYQAQSARLGLEKRVHFAGWRNDRAALLALADICVLPSRYESFGTVMAEAWFAGVPLVATRAAGAMQYVSHGKNGLLSDIDDVEALAHHLHLLTAVPKLKKRLVREGRKTYEELFERGVVTAQLIKITMICVRVMPPLSKNKILVIKHGALGDILQAMDAFASIREAHAGAHLAVLTTPPFVEFLRDAPYFDAVLADPRAPFYRLDAWWRMRRILRGGWGGFMTCKARRAPHIICAISCAGWRLILSVKLPPRGF